MVLPLTPLRCLERAVNVFPNKTGVICGEKRFSYSQLGERCGRLAAALKTLGVHKGERVAYLSFNTHKLYEAYFGVVQAGAIVMPVNVRLALNELEDILNHAEPAILFYENDFAPTVARLRNACRSIRQFVALDEVTDAEIHYEELLAESAPLALDPYSVEDKDVAELFYTSGSTGMPKGVMLSHRALYLHALAIATVCEDPATMVDLHTIPLFHANGWGHAHTSTLVGATQVMVRRFDPVQVFGLIDKHRATDMAVIPTMGNALLQVPDPARFDLSSMRQIQIGGAASSPALIERLEKLFCCQVYTGYGLTESGPVVALAKKKWDSLDLPDEERWRKLSSTGWPIAGAILRVVDGQMNDVPRDGQSIGEIIASTDWLMSGYYKDPDESAAVLTGPRGEPGGVSGAPLWLHTGDMAVWDEQRYLTIVDRKKEIIISGGENISSLEIEKFLYSHPSVLECAVVAAPDERWGEVPVAIVVGKAGAVLTEEDLLEHLKRVLSRFKLPKLIKIVQDPLPKTGTGKIKKRDLREPFWKDHEKRVKG
jgi:fatty-acyl-CoA synthase